jgi:uncharacterized protein YbbC (DUF1343 family)
MAFELGIDRLLSDTSLQKELHGRNIALLAHPASMTSDFQHSIDALMLLPDIHLTAAFGPQHGMRGEKQDNMVETENYLDPVYKIPVYSLYGEVRKPTPQMMESFDVLLVDLQDIGTRIYTFLTTLLYVLEACAKHGKTIWILDRPNPAGRQVEGSLLKPGWISFVGAAEGLPMRHGLTLGEAAGWMIAKLGIKVDCKVIAMKDYAPNQAPGYGWPSELAWVNPSPNAATLAMARAFPGTVMIEGTNLSEARGTTHPLEIVGAPGLDTAKVIKKMAEISGPWMRGCRLRPCYFQPTFQKHVGKICSGFQIHVDEPFYKPESFKPYRLIALWLKAIRSLHPNFEIWRDFHYEYEKDRMAIDLINGGPGLREWVDDAKAIAADFEEILEIDEAAWLKDSAPYLLYK